MYTVLKIKILNTTYTFISLMLFALTNLSAQNSPSGIDHSGFITRYDRTFNGIGPHVYFLPPPPSKQDSINKLMVEFIKINDFNDTLQQAFLYQDLIYNYAKTNNSDYVIETIKNKSIQPEEWDKELANQIKEKNYPFAIGLLNELAEHYIIKKETIKAEKLLSTGIEIASSQKLINEQFTLQSNLTSLYLLNKKYAEANKIAKEQYKYIQNEKSATKQANSLLNMAVIQAYANESTAAENTIIRRVIPLLNKAKDYDAKINAWIKLAQIYTLNKKYPEAQWFLIQAQELAETKSIEKYNSTIEYLLGSSKYHQNNLLVSKKELELALNLAKTAGDKHIEISATQILGEINLKLRDVNEAELFLKSYWKLRSELF